MAFNDQKGLQTRVERYKTQHATFDKQIAAFKKTLVVPELKATAAEIEKLVEQLHATQERILELAKLDKAADGHALLVGARATTRQLEGLMRRPPTSRGSSCARRPRTPTPRTGARASSCSP